MAAASGEPGVPPPDVPGQVPDDASALEPDRLAWLAEQRALRRRDRLRRLFPGRPGLGPVVALCLAVTAAMGAFSVAMMRPGSMPRPQAAPLATAAVATVTSPADAPAVEPPAGGVIGRRLPAAALDGDARPISSADLRPAVLALLPQACGCAGALQEAYRQVGERGLDLWLIGSGTDPAVAAQLVNLDETGTHGGARWAIDRSGRLATALAGRGLTLVSVGSDGTIAGLARDLPLDGAALPDLDPLLARLTATSR